MNLDSVIAPTLEALRPDAAGGKTVLESENLATGGSIRADAGSF
jgi:hypothetical protein